MEHLAAALDWRRQSSVRRAQAAGPTGSRFPLPFPNPFPALARRAEIRVHMTRARALTTTREAKRPGFGSVHELLENVAARQSVRVGTGRDRGMQGEIGPKRD